ncbi:hypothetical protein HK44_003680 [Pseudomonas fluorescens HK44]|uniref:Uncharacterized protein n=1 Tax=Pseudomonas fluorescens HK44 TaxID=1042209 RepID=A0A010RNH8_PSEFL|nr:hypothetical protein HK44_003680 [Pseudomonas fluorescens HK44]
MCLQGSVIDVLFYAVVDLAGLELIVWRHLIAD